MSPTDVVTRDTPIRLAKPRWRVIIDDTCAEFGIPPEALLVPGGPRRYVPARITLARRLSSAGYGYAPIGRWMHRDHTTVLWYCGRKASRNQAQPVNPGEDPVPLPPVPDYVQRRQTLLHWLSSKWVTARALATVTSLDYDRVRGDLGAMQRDGIVQRSGYDRPVYWRLK